MSSSNAEHDSPVSTGISMSELQNWFADYRSKHVMFVADSCYSGLALTTRSTGLDPQTQDYLKHITSRKVRVARSYRVIVSHEGQPGLTHLPDSQTRSPLHCVSYWQPCAAAGADCDVLLPP